MRFLSRCGERLERVSVEVDRRSLAEANFQRRELTASGLAADGRLRLDPVPPIRREPASEESSEVTSEQGPSGWDDQRLRGIPVIAPRSSSARRDTLPHVAGIERADRSLALQRADGWFTSEREQELRTAAAAAPKRPHATKLLRQRCEDVFLALSENAEVGERLLALSYVVWPGEQDPHRELLRGGADPSLACEKDVRHFLIERCEPGESTPAHDVERAFEKWCIERPRADALEARLQDPRPAGLPRAARLAIGRRARLPVRRPRAARLNSEVRTGVRTRRAFPAHPAHMTHDHAVLV
jgi:hypothetical protein